MTPKRIAWYGMVILSSLLALGSSAKHPNKDSSDKNKTADPAVEQALTTNSANPSLYAGTDTCKACHEEIAKTYDHGPHWKTMLNHRGVQYQGCEACHGPGKEHAESGGDISKIISFKT